MGWRRNDYVVYLCINVKGNEDGGDVRMTGGKKDVRKETCGVSVSPRNFCGAVLQMDGVTITEPSTAGWNFPNVAASIDLT